MKRREFLGSTMALAALAAVNRPVHAADDGPIVIFGYDGLAVDFALQLAAANPQGALNRMQSGIGCLTTDGFSMTQPGWCQIWHGLPAAFTGILYNEDAIATLSATHIVRRVYILRALDSLVWITGKGRNISGFYDQTPGPHYDVYKIIAELGLPGAYFGDVGRENSEVTELASIHLPTLGPHGIAFVHYHDPDDTGHATESVDQYLASAASVDNDVAMLMDLCPTGTHFILCSDHGWNFKELGDLETNHVYAPHGFVAFSDAITTPPTLFELRGNTVSAPMFNQPTVAAKIYRHFGGDPRLIKVGNVTRSLYHTGTI
jgi:hypothetical protein